MATIERINNFQYYLSSKEFGLQRIQTPKNYDNDSIKVERNPESKAFIEETNIGLKFYGNAVDYIMQGFRSFGPSWVCSIVKYERDPKSQHEQFKLRYIQKIDQATLKHDVDKGELSLKSTQGGLYNDINDRKADEVDIVTDQSMDGDYIGNLKTYKFTPTPRNIFRETKLSKSVNGYRLHSGRWSFNASDAYIGIPIDIVYSSHPDANNVFDPTNASSSSHSMPNTIGSQQRVTDQFFLVAERDLTLRVKFNLRFKITKVHKEDSSDENYQIQFRRSSGENIQLQSIETLLNLGDPGNDVGAIKTVNFDRVLDVKEGESLSFVFYSFGIYGGGPSGNNNRMVVDQDILSSEIMITDSTPFKPSTSRSIKAIDAINRMIAKITGKNNIVKSSVFGIGGKYEHVIFDNGFWARGFKDIEIDEDTGEEKRTQFVLSWELLFQAFNYIEPMAWFIEIEGKEEYIRVEPATYTMKNFIGIDFGVVDNLHIESKGKDFFSKIVIGMDNEVEYEEINGLNEYNGLTKASTHVKEGKSEYTATTKIRIDAEGYELTRRKQRIDNPTLDTKRDDEVWMHWARFVPPNSYVHKTWHDDFDQAPTGIFDPDSAWNLYFSPFNRLLYGHGYSVNRSLYHLPEKNIRFSSSNANSNLVTVRGGYELKENGIIPVEDLGKPYIEPEKMKFELSYNRNIYNQITGVTKINGENIPNYFGLCKFTYRGADYYGRLLKVETENKIKVEIITAHL